MQSVKKIAKLYDDFMHFVVHNMFLFTVIAICATHVVLLILMSIGNVGPLIYLNVLNIIVDIFCIILCIHGHAIPVYVSIVLEISLYVIISNYILGWNNFSYCFLYCILPATIYFGANLIRRKYRTVIALIIMFYFCIILFCYLRYFNYVPPYSIENETIKHIMALFSMFMMAFTNGFYIAMYVFDAREREKTLNNKNEKLAADATVDTLTGLLNRRGFYSFINNGEAEKYQYYCVAFCDIDNFKRVNDTYGHDAGDEILSHIGKMLVRDMKGCIISRWGGEEIVIFMPDYDFEVAKQKMEYIRKKIEITPTTFYNKKINVTVSIGVKEMDSEHTIEQLIRIADERMYYGKQHGKNIVISEDCIEDE